MKIDQTAIDLICNGKNVCLDMHDIDTELLPTKEDVLLLLRNLDINVDIVKLDFSKCRYEDKAEWLTLYATAKEKIEINELSEAWAQIIHAMLSQQLTDVHCSLLDEHQLKSFVKDNIELCTDVAQLLHDSMEWAAATAAKAQYQHSKTADRQLSANILFCCKNIDCFDFDLHAAFKTCKLWPTILVAENFEVLKDMLQKSKCCMLLYGQHTPQWNEFCNLINKIKGY